MPRQCGAFYPHRELAHTRHDLEAVRLVPELRRHVQRVERLVRADGVEHVEQPPRLRLAPPLQELGHHRGGRGRDGAAAALEGHVIETARPVQLDEDMHPVAAERVVALRLAVGVLDAAEIARTAAVVEDHLLVKLAQLVHRPKISATSSSASTSRSTSLFML